MANKFLLNNIYNSHNGTTEQATFCLSPGCVYSALIETKDDQDVAWEKMARKQKTDDTALDWGDNTLNTIYI